MHILVCDDDAAFSAKVAEYAATYFEAHEIPVQALSLIHISEPTRPY